MKIEHNCASMAYRVCVDQLNCYSNRFVWTDDGWRFVHVANTPSLSSARACDRGMKPSSSTTEAPSHHPQPHHASQQPLGHVMEMMHPQEHRYDHAKIAQSVRVTFGCGGSKLCGSDQPECGGFRVCMNQSFYYVVVVCTYYMTKCSVSVPHDSPGQSQGVPRATVSTSPAVMERMWMPRDGTDPPLLSSTSSSLMSQADTSHPLLSTTPSTLMSDETTKSSISAGAYNSAGDAWLPSGLTISADALSLAGTPSPHDDDWGIIPPSSLTQLCLSVPIDFDPTQNQSTLAPSSSFSMKRSVLGTFYPKRRRLLAPRDSKAALDTAGAPSVTFAATTNTEMDWIAVASFTRDEDEGCVGGDRTDDHLAADSALSHDFIALAPAAAAAPAVPAPTMTTAVRQRSPLSKLSIDLDLMLLPLIMILRASLNATHFETKVPTQYVFSPQFSDPELQTQSRTGAIETASQAESVNGDFLALLVAAACAQPPAVEQNGILSVPELPVPEPPVLERGRDVIASVDDDVVTPPSPEIAEVATSVPQTVRTISFLA